MRESEERVLIVDDDDSIRQLLWTLVNREGVPVDCAADGVAAIEKIKEGRNYSLILLDLMMPRVDGFGVVDFLREHPSQPKPIVLVITAYTDQRYKELDPEIVAGVLRKPFDVADVGQLVSLWANRRSEDVRQLVQQSLNRPALADS